MLQIFHPFFLFGMSGCLGSITCLRFGFQFHGSLLARPVLHRTAFSSYGSLVRVPQFVGLCWLYCGASLSRRKVLRWKSAAFMLKNVSGGEWETNPISRIQSKGWRRLATNRRSCDGAKKPMTPRHSLRHDERSKAFATKRQTADESLTTKALSSTRNPEWQ